MDKSVFYKIYLPALRQALEEDHINDGFMVRSAEYFIDKQYVREVALLLESDYADDPFIILAEEYFDAKSHYAPDINGMPIAAVKTEILRQLRAIEDALNLNS